MFLLMFLKEYVINSTKKKLKYLKRECGFTLVEALIALGITGILALGSFPFIVGLYDYVQLNQALTVFQSDLHGMRDFNMTLAGTKGRMSMRIYHDEDRYVVLVGGDLYRERKLPSRIRIVGNAPTSTISFNEAGNLGAGRTIVISGSEHERRVVFSIGIGGFDVRR